MNTQDINKYIGIKHYFGGESFEACDCIGLVRLFFKEHGSPLTFDDGKPVTRENYHSVTAWRRLIKYLNQHCRRLKKNELPQYGDIILFRIEGDEHMGIMLTKYGDCLAMEVPVKEGFTMSRIYHRTLWRLAEHKIYRPKEGEGVNGDT